MTSPNNLDKLVDIVIPTFNRPDFLQRILKYYQLSNSSSRFIVADTSNKSNKLLNKKIISKSILNIKYLDKLPEGISLHSKLILATKYLKRKYCVFCADDDFVISSSVRESVNFLEKHLDYSAAHGIYLGYHFFNIPLFAKRLFWKTRYTPYTILSPQKLSRLQSHLENYVLVLWAVRRTNEVKKNYLIFEKLNIDSYLMPVFGELIPDALTAISGKIKAFSSIYGVRQYFGSVSSYFPSLIEAKKKGRYYNNYHSFKNILVKQVGLKKRSRTGDINSQIDNIMESYINYSYQEHFINKIYFVLNKCPKWFSLLFRQLHALYLFSKTDKMTNKNFLKRSSDLEQIKQLIFQSGI